MEIAATAGEILNIKQLLAVIGILLGCNIAIIVYFAKRYISRFERNHDLLHSIDVSQIKKDHDLLLKITTEHKTFHKSETGINGNGG